MKKQLLTLTLLASTQAAQAMANTAIPLKPIVSNKDGVVYYAAEEMQEMKSTSGDPATYQMTTLTPANPQPMQATVSQDQVQLNALRHNVIDASHEVANTGGSGAALMKLDTASVALAKFLHASTTNLP